jgi:hypothetical protein
MSRAKVFDNSNAVSLFPFLAVLLCTMGALIVVLVGVTRLSRANALEQVAAEKPADSSEAADLPDVDADRMQREHDQAVAFVAKLQEVRERSAQQLHEDQARLSHLEDHIRRLQEKLDSLRMAAADLEGMQQEHYDDREQAQRELARLEQLIEESQEAVKELKNESQATRRSYAIVPYEGPNGTKRRPMYIECRQDEVLLQPEGIHLTPDDFRPPLGPGNPLASALRAGREFILRDGASPAAGGEANDPYPLILVRPDGIVAYYRVRSAIESWDADFGYEFVDGDWDLKFPPANPQLATVEYRAVETARARMQMLAAAAPRAFGDYRSTNSGFNYEDDSLDDVEVGSGLGAGSDGGLTGHASFDGSSGGTDHELFVAVVKGTVGTDANGPGETSNVDLVDVDQETNRAADNVSLESRRSGHGGAVERRDSKSGDSMADGNVADQSAEAVSGEPTGAPTAATTANDIASTTEPTSSTSSEKMTDVSEQGTPQRVSANRPSNRPPGEQSRTVQGMKVRGKNWAIREPNPGEVAIRRTIQIVVRRDSLAILPEQNGPTRSTDGGREFQLTGSTAAVVNDFVAAVQQQIDRWGMAGSGLYWRPVLELHVGPDGSERASDLARLLKDSGLELRSDAVASQTEGEVGRENR